MVGGKSQSQSFHFNIYGISASAISSPLSMAMEFPLVGPFSRFVLSRWIISSHLVCCVFLESGCQCLSLESRHLFLHLFVIENGGRLKGKWIRWLDMILYMIFIYGRTSVFSPFVFFFIFDAISGGNNVQEHAMIYNGYDLERLVPIIIEPVGFSCKYHYYVSPPHSPHLFT